VVRYFARVDDGEFIYLVLERCECSLAQALARCAIERRKVYRRMAPGGMEGLWNPATRLVLVPPPSDATRRFMRELVSGVAHLHDLRIVHRDIKPHNILLSSMEGEAEEAPGASAGPSTVPEAPEEGAAVSLLGTECPPACRVVAADRLRRR
jgi:serine/threonine protein kinase